LVRLGGFTGAFMVGWVKDQTGSLLLGFLAMATVPTAATALAASLRLVVRQE
jgi:ACS family tartrate transporter-like MFS transporter